MRRGELSLSDTPGALALDWVILTAVLLGTTVAVLVTGTVGG